VAEREPGQLGKGCAPSHAPALAAAARAQRGICLLVAQLFVRGLVPLVPLRRGNK